jgi:hypothetical protein
MWTAKRRDYDDGGDWDTCATFKVRKDEFIDGFTAYESSIKGQERYFIRHQNF